MILFSVTDLSMYDYCKRKFYLQKKLKLKEPIKPSLIIGKIKHNTIEQFTIKEKELLLKIKKSYEEEQIKKILEETYNKIYKEEIIKNKNYLYDFNISIEEVYEDKKVFLADINLRTKIILQNIKKGLIGEELYKKMNPKIITEKKIEIKNYSLKGIIDRIIEEKKEEKTILKIYEFKTGKSPKTGIWNSQKIQLESYLILLKEKTKKEEEKKETNKKEEQKIIVEEGIIHYIDENIERKIKYNPFMRIEVLKKVEELKETLKENKIPEKTLNKNKCKNCGLKEYCYNEELLKKLLEKNTYEENKNNQ